MFSDRVTAYVEAGRGGNGAIAFRREKYVPKGGPNGGDGGPGGNVVVVADPNLRDLSALRWHPHIRAKAGNPGEGANRTGATGADEIVKVPVGTQVVAEDGTLVCDLAHAGARAVIARGGRGGPGNQRFATATRQSPRIAGIGEEGDVRTLTLQLKLMADAALLGFPNVGKSSLLRRISNATPKVGDYPFTTIEPVLGTVDAGDDRQLTVVDVPGLLEGASDGVGLGHEFLAHLERARLLIHVVDAGGAADDVAAARNDFFVIWRELQLRGHGLAERPRIVVLNRIDLVEEERRGPLVDEFRALVAANESAADEMVIRDDDDQPVVLASSCATGAGIPAFVHALFAHIPERVAVVETEPELVDYLVYRPGRKDKTAFRLFRDDGALRVVCVELEELAAAIDPENPGDARRLSERLSELGVARALKGAGAKDGDFVLIGEERFQYAPDPERV